MAKAKQMFTAAQKQQIASVAAVLAEARTRDTNGLLVDAAAEASIILQAARLVTRVDDIVNVLQDNPELLYDGIDGVDRVKDLIRVDCAAKLAELKAEDEETAADDADVDSNAG